MDQNPQSTASSRLQPEPPTPMLRDIPTTPTPMLSLSLPVIFGDHPQPPTSPSTTHSRAIVSSPALLPNSHASESTRPFITSADSDSLTVLPLHLPTQNLLSRKRRREESGSVLDFVDAAPEHLRCSICHQVFTKPVIVNGCGHEFCDACLRRALTVKEECPLCRQAISTLGPFCTPLRRVQEEISKLRVRCPYAQAGGCESVLTISELDAHIESCPYAVVECHHCAHGCEWEGARQGLSQHLSECQFEKMKGFTSKLSTDISELKTQNATLQTEVRRLKGIESVLKLRGDRLRDLHKHKLGFGEPGIDTRVTVVRVVERGVVQWMFKVKTSTKLGKIQEIVQLKRGKPVLLTCDGPLQNGGTVVDKNDSLLDLGLATSSISSQNGVILFAEVL